MPEPLARPVPLPSPSSLPFPLSLAMIVKDSAKTLGACLASIRPWVDEMLILDTGSTDETAEIARSFGATVRHFAWCDDFSAARNESMRDAQGRWILWMDSDETIDEANGRKLRDLVESHDDPEILGYWVNITSANSRDGDYKLIRNGIRFKYRVHESPEESLRDTVGKCSNPGLSISHSGHDCAKLSSAKSARNLRLLEISISEHPDDLKILNDIYRENYNLDNFQAVLRYSSRVFNHPEMTAEQLVLATDTFIKANIMAGRYDEASGVIETALESFPDEPAFLRVRGFLKLTLGRPYEAGIDFLETLERNPTDNDRFIADECLGQIRASVGEIAWHRLLERHRDRIACRPRVA